MDGSSCVYVFWQHVYVYVVNKCVWRCVYVYVVMFDWYPIRKSVRSGYWVPDRLTNWIPIKHHNLHTHTHTHTAIHIYSRHTCTHVAKKRTHRNYHPCLPQGHYGFHILCFPLLTGRLPHAVGHGLILLMMGILMPETC